jgi:uncharacterized phage protein (TIGR01671 family)
MSREIKFRAWNGEQMVSPDYITRDGIGYWKEDSIPSYSKELMQFTGLQDKNGVDIYEGDVVLVKGTKRIGDYITKVVFKGQLFTLDINNTYLNYDSCLKVGVEVIGNIHENKN